MASFTGTMDFPRTDSVAGPVVQRQGYRLRSPVGLLHAVVTAAVGYQLYFSGVSQAAPLITIALLASSATLSLLMVTVSETMFATGWFVSLIALADTVMATTTLYQAHGQTPMLYVVYILIIIASVCLSLPLTCGISSFVTLAYGSQLYLWNLFDEGHLLQLPILFTMATFYAYNSEMTRQELNRFKRVEGKALGDPLTRLPNREHFVKKLQTALQHVSPYGPPSLAVLFVDLDKFKPVNDAFGHQIGDQLLVAVAERMITCVGPNDIVCRYGGDEFILLLQGLHGTEDAERIVSRLLFSLQQPVYLRGHDIRIGASIGLAVKTNVWDQAEDLIARADQAMYGAKNGQPRKLAA